MSDNSVRLIGGNHNGPMILLDGEGAVPYGEIELVYSYYREDLRKVDVKIRSKPAALIVDGTVESVTADINRQLAEFSRACSTMVVEIPKGGE